MNYYLAQNQEKEDEKLNLEINSKILKDETNNLTQNTIPSGISNVNSASIDQIKNETPIPNTTENLPHSNQVRIKNDESDKNKHVIQIKKDEDVDLKKIKV